MGKIMARKILLLDFDGTLTILHTHTHEASGVTSPDKENNQLKKANLRHPHILCIIINKWLRDGGEVGVVSFHDGRLYCNEKGPEYIRNYLRLGIPGINIDAIHIVAFDSSAQKEPGKKPQIKKYFEECYNRKYTNEKIDINNKEHMINVILADDSDSNVDGAIKMGAKKSIHFPARQLDIDGTTVVLPAEGLDEAPLIKLMLEANLSPEELEKETAELRNATDRALKEEAEFVKGLIKQYKIAYITHQAIEAKHQAEQRKTANGQQAQQKPLESLEERRAKMLRAFGERDKKAEKDKSQDKANPLVPGTKPVAAKSETPSVASVDQIKTVLSELVMFYLNNKEMIDSTLAEIEKRDAAVKEKEKSNKVRI